MGMRVLMDMKPSIHAGGVLISLGPEPRAIEIGVHVHVKI